MPLHVEGAGILGVTANCSTAKPDSRCRSYTLWLRPSPHFALVCLPRKTKEDDGEWRACRSSSYTLRISCDRQGQ